ncbi:MAG: hypothetical protein ACRDWD_08325 [Acidimicrobiia bacterium]
MPHRIEVHPERFTLVSYVTEDVARIASEESARVGLPETLRVRLEVDEGLPSPLSGWAADLAEGEARVWISGGDFEDPRFRLQLSEPLARQTLAMAFLRIGDRLGPCADAPADTELTDRQRAAWDVWAEGRAARLGVHSHPNRRRYHYRLAHGFNDVADAVFDRLWAADELGWADLQAACAETEAVDARQPPKSRTVLQR